MAGRQPATVVAGRPALQARPLPSPWQLAGLGTVLCMYRSQRGGELAGWTQAVRAECDVAMGSDGLCESLSFFDAHGECCWRLFLLPDSDFLAWDTLAARFPARLHGATGHGMAERLWRRLAGRLGGDAWQLCALRLHVPAQRGGEPTLAASPAKVSPLGASTARRVARQEGAEGEVRLDDCCCARAAAAALRISPASGSGVPLVRL